VEGYDLVTVFEFVMLVMQMGAFCTSLASNQYTKTLYWAGAFMITLAVVRGLK